MRTAAVLLLILSMTIFHSSAQAREERRDPETGKIRVMYLGDCIVQDNPSLAFIPEPWIDVTRIPASSHWRDAHEAFLGESVAKLMRRYMPRTYADLVGKFDSIILSDANVHMFQLQHLEWFKRAVGEDGLGMTMVGGDETFGGYGSHPSWGPTSVGDILPVSCVDGLHPRGARYFPCVENPDHPFITSLPLDTSPLPSFGGFSATIKKQAANQLARLDVMGRFGSTNWPFLVEWDWRKGRVFAFTSDWTAASGDLFLLWDYYDDFCINLMLHVNGVEIPHDMELLHMVRARIREYGMNKMFLYAMIEFIERFGAQTGPVEKKILEAEEVKHEADGLYMEIDLDGALASIERGLGILSEADGLAKRLKDSALFHVYLIEWFAVTGVSLLAGWVVFELMVRRRMYREASTTRLGR